MLSLSPLRGARCLTNKIKNMDKKQEIADKLTNEILCYFFGDRFRECDNVEDDYEMNHAWEYFNDAIYGELNQLIGD